MDLRELVNQIVEYEHMGEVTEQANIELQLKTNSLTIRWDARFEGETVRQAAFFKFTGIQLTDKGA